MLKSITYQSVIHCPSCVWDKYAEASVGSCPKKCTINGIQHFRNVFCMNDFPSYFLKGLKMEWMLKKLEGGMWPTKENQKGRTMWMVVSKGWFSLTWCSTHNSISLSAADYQGVLRNIRWPLGGARMLPSLHDSFPRGLQIWDWI